ncbi:hypothetical protein [Streptomyces aureocirculatus]|uniref:hypothetical protein n=1 Tax=Streptomyces aureocirculatus TaxID=67275 RepID=UPI0004C7B1C9|nr:hypothetical protein [Streptomyces aureocirculatus]
MDELRQSPAQIPRRLLDDPSFRRAVQHRDFTLVFAMAHRTGISFNRIGEACGMKAERASKVARGEATVTALDTVERVADGLRIPGALLGLAARLWEDNPPTPHREFDDGDDPMNRRQLFRGAFAAGLTGAALTALTDTRQSLNLALASDTDLAGLADLETAAETYGYGYHGQMPTRVVADLAGDFTELRPYLDTPQPVATRVRVCRTAAQMAGMIAIVLHDLGARKEARKWFATAGTAAQESGDRQLHAWVLAREAMVPLNYGAPQAAARLAEQARFAAGNRPTAAATLSAAVAARAYALSHQHEQARQAVRAAEVLMERLDAGARADTWLTHGEQKHHVHLSHAFTVLGDTRRARQSQERALELSAPTSTMTRSLLTIDGAACFHHDGDTEQACRRTIAVLDSLSDAYRSGLVHQRAMNLYHSIPDRHHHEAVVDELRDALAA